jgi:hypothetical protein
MNKRAQSLIALPEGFAIPTNPGLHGDMLFFELESHQLTTSEPKVDGDKVHFFYYGWDSDEGQVTITYQTISGSPADAPVVDEGWDVEITTWSDVWGLADTLGAVQDAVKLHQALGRDKPCCE